MPLSLEQLSDRIDKIHTKIRDNVKQMEEDIKTVNEIINQEKFKIFQTNLTKLDLSNEEEIIERALEFLQDAKKTISYEKKRREIVKEFNILQNRAKIKKERKAKRLQYKLYRNPYARENSQEKDIGDKESTS